jgi:predicted signal transduction protein with EAL and GGDEF domain
VRRGDLAARLSGDEFVVALIDPQGLHGAQGAAHNLRDVLTRPFEVGDEQCWVTPSMGIALFPDDADDADALIRMADLAMYEAKGRGPNQTSHPDRARGSERADRFQLVNGLRHALSRGELSVHFQPQIDLESGSATAVEALPRWRHRSEGWVSPGVFIPIAEQSGMVVALGDWVLRRACAAALAWEADLTVAVNVSPVQLADPDFAARWSKIIRATGLPPDRLEIEIAESGFGETGGVSAENLSRLRELGVRIVLDDFGTGTSSPCSSENGTSWARTSSTAGVPGTSPATSPNPGSKNPA